MAKRETNARKKRQARTLPVEYLARASEFSADPLLDDPLAGFIAARPGLWQEDIGEH